MSEWLIVLITVAGLTFGGGHFVVGAAAIGRRCGMSPILVGATIVAIGTSLPEWAVSVDAVLAGSVKLSGGNVIGSNVCNVGIILGIAILIAPIAVPRLWVRRDGMIMLVATAVLLGFSLDGTISRIEGAILLALAIATIGFLIYTGRETGEIDPEDPAVHEPWRWWQLPRAIAGLALVLISSHFFVDAAQEIAKQLNVSEWLIGITVAAIGTSLPELVTSIAASRKRHGGIVVGNILGSNTMNIFFVLGSAGSIAPIPSGDFTLLSASTFTALMVLVVVFMATKLRLSRWEGGILLAAGLGWYLLGALEGPPPRVPGQSPATANSASPRSQSNKVQTMTHAWHDVTPGQRLPGEFTTVIEIPMGSSVKYELDKLTGLLRLDRVLYSALFFPANYGFIPQTLAEDDDPLDVLVLCQGNLAPLTLVDARAIGIMTMIDSGKRDHKVLAVAVSDPEYSGFHDVDDLPPHRLAMVRRFFQDYKVLEGKSVEVDQFQPAAAAHPVIEDALERYSEHRRRGFMARPPGTA